MINAVGGAWYVWIGRMKIGYENGFFFCYSFTVLYCKQIFFIYLSILMHLAQFWIFSVCKICLSKFHTYIFLYQTTNQVFIWCLLRLPFWHLGHMPPFSPFSFGPLFLSLWYPLFLLWFSISDDGNFFGVWVGLDFKSLDSGFEKRAWNDL